MADADLPMPGPAAETRSMTTRDGVRLDADIYRPGGRPWPVLFQRAGLWAADRPRHLLRTSGLACGARLYGGGAGCARARYLRRAVRAGPARGFRRRRGGRAGRRGEDRPAMLASSVSPVSGLQPVPHRIGRLPVAEGDGARDGAVGRRRKLDVREWHAAAQAGGRLGRADHCGGRAAGGRCRRLAPRSPPPVCRSAARSRRVPTC